MDHHLLSFNYMLSHDYQSVAVGMIERHEIMANECSILWDSAMTGAIRYDRVRVAEAFLRWQSLKVPSVESMLRACQSAEMVAMLSRYCYWVDVPGSWSATPFEYKCEDDINVALAMLKCFPTMRLRICRISRSRLAKPLYPLFFRMAMVTMLSSDMVRHFY
jgi:hypothetical protein